jgi:hypothetical protein
MYSLLNNLENKKGFFFGGCFSPMHLFAQNNYASMVELLVDLSCIWKNEEERYRKSFEQSNLAFTTFHVHEMTNSIMYGKNSVVVDTEFQMFEFEN